jgi:hypothetical protein
VRGGGGEGGGGISNVRVRPVEEGGVTSSKNTFESVQRDGGSDQNYGLIYQ